MKKYILKSLFVSVLCMLAASCQDTEFVETLDSSKAQVMFSVAMDSPAARSRATWGDDYTPSDLGDEYDNRIDLDQFIVKIEAGGKTYNVTDIIKWKEGETNEYKFVGIVKNQNGENVGKVNLPKAKISVYANMGNDANANFATMTFNQDAENIPMWGALTVENLEFAPGKRTNVDDIYLLRAMAKFQVTLGEDAIEKGYTLTKASLNKFNLVGNNMPTGYADATSTMTLGLEDVMNENTSNLAGATELTEATEDGNGWVIYLPEISNTTASELKMLLTFSKEGSGQIETEVSVKDYSTANTGLVNIVRNHWYKYVIEDIVNAKPVVNYKAIDWTSVNINVGGEGFLALSTDLVEIYNANTGQLKFTSSSPITITRADVYEHKRNGEIVKRQEINNVDPIDAYYISKFGQKIQLGTDPGFDVENKEAVLEKETQILNAISATCDEGTLSGDITINSPFVGQATDENCNYNTIRYIEFLVTNEDELSATFRVMQYPPVVITNIEGYFSYRDDFTRTDNEGPAYWTNYMGVGSVTTMGIVLTHEHDWTNEKNQSQNWFNTRQSDRSYAWLTGEYPWLDNTNNNCGKTGKGEERWEEMRYSMVAHYVNFKDANNNEKTGMFQGGYRPYEPSSPIFFRERYDKLPGATEMDKKGAAVGYPYEKVITLADGTTETRIFRKHYTWDVQTIFWSKYVKNVFQKDDEITVTENKKTVNYKRLKGQASMYSIADNYTTYKDGGDVYNPDDVVDGGGKFIDYGINGKWKNHRMYHIKATMTSDKYTLGRPSLLDENGNPTDNAERGVVDNVPSNANLVSPSLMLASQLGETNYNYIIANCKQYGYNLPKLSDFYELAKKHCREYVESTWDDTNGNGQPDEGEPVTQYHDWRLPTKAEIEMIIDYQNSSRAMDIVLIGEHFVCVTGQPGLGDDEEYWVSSEVPTYKVSAEEDIDGRGYTNTGYYIRCVRDVMTDETKNNK